MSRKKNRLAEEPGDPPVVHNRLEVAVNRTNPAVREVVEEIRAPIGGVLEAGPCPAGHPVGRLLGRRGRSNQDDQTRQGNPQQFMTHDRSPV